MKKIYSLLFTMLLAFVGAGSAWATEYHAGDDVNLDQLQVGDVIEYGVVFNTTDDYWLAFFSSKTSIADDCWDDYINLMFIQNEISIINESSIYSPGNKYEVVENRGLDMTEYFATVFVLVPKVQTTTQPASVTGSDGNEYFYGTYYANYNWKVPAGYEALIVSNVGSSAVTISKLAEEGQTVPANEGVLLRGTAYNTNITIEGSEEQPVDCPTNYLEGVTTDQPVSGNNKIYYKLSYKGGTNLGFYWDGTAELVNGLGINAKAYKAYLAIPNSTSSNHLALRFEDTVTAINSAKTQSISDTYYNMQGQRANAGSNGILIRNGHKYIAR